MKLTVPTAATISDWQAKMRAAVFDGIREGDVKEIIATLVRNAKAGDVSACRMIFDYVLGGKGQASPMVAVGINVQESPAPMPAPMPALNGHPGSKERIASMRNRAANGHKLSDDED